MLHCAASGDFAPLVRRHRTRHFRKRATSVPAEGPAYGLDFARHCESPLPALQAQSVMFTEVARLALPGPPLGSARARSSPRGRTSPGGSRPVRTRGAVKLSCNVCVYDIYICVCIYIYICIYMYIYIYVLSIYLSIYRSISLFLSLSLYIYICITCYISI